MADENSSAMSARLQRLEDENAIRATLYRYGFALDYGDRDQFLECFTAEASYVVTLRSLSDPVLEFHGSAALGDYFDSHTHAPAAWHKHVTTNDQLVVDGDRASVVSYFIRIDAGEASGPAIVHASGRYIDAFVRDGESWRIRTRLCEVENL